MDTQISEIPTEVGAEEEEEEETDENGTVSFYVEKVVAYKEEDIGKFLLGGYDADQEINFIPSNLNYSYKNLARKPNLQKPDNYCLKFRSPNAERIFHRLWNDGDFKVQIYLDEDKNTMTSVFSWALLPFEDDDINLLDEGNSLLIYPMLAKWGAVGTPESFKRSESYMTSNRMKAIFTQRQLEALRIRITHRLFRECASRISEFWREMILESLAEDCKRRGYWSDNVDIHMILADTAIHLGCPKWDCRLVNVSNEWEAKGKFDLAIQIEEDIQMIMTHPEDFPTFPPVKSIPENITQGRLGCLYMYDGDWDSSLNAFLKAMRADCQLAGGGMLWDHRNSDQASWVENFCYMLLHFSQKDGGIEEAKLYSGLFAGLLSRAGYRCDGSTDSQRFKVFELTILPSIHKEKAISILGTLFKSPSVEDFRSTLISCKHPVFSGHGMPPVLKFRDKKEWKNILRKRPSFLLYEGIHPIPPDCDNPSCQEKDLVRSKLGDCSQCHVVRYCSKQCQVQHWPAHKRECKQWRKDGPRSLPVEESKKL